jgi:hypothetical protein
MLGRSRIRALFQLFRILDHAITDGLLMELAFQYGSVDKVKKVPGRGCHLAE